MDNTQASKFFTSKPVIIMFSVAGGLFGFGLITRIISRILKNQKKKEKIENQDKETETAMELARTLRNLLAYDRTQPGPHVVAAMDEETGLEKQTVERFIEHMLQEKPARLSSQVLEIFTSNYSTKLGEGAYGAVYKGHFPNGGQVAVKVLNNQGIDKRIEEQFMAEVNTIGRTYHRNLVRLYGFCFEAKTKALVYEYMENGSLDKLLFEKKHNIEWDKLYEIAIGAARGLEYLHHFSHGRIIHYDIKPANVLLDSNFCPKIEDFRGWS